MARYAIGDIQGCYTELQLLLDRMQFDPQRDTLYLVGDLVNRGPDSLAVLRWVMRQGAAVQTVLGNHDLHLLAIAAGVSKAKLGDTMATVLQAPDLPEIVDWLRRQPLMLTLSDAIVVHAGIWPGWDARLAQSLADEVGSVLAGNQWRSFLAAMYGNQPLQWSDALQGDDRLRFVVNAATRMRFVDTAGALQLKYKGELDRAPAGLCPWFEWPQRVATPRVICGHWSALGLRVSETLWALDTGCIWGGALTGVDLDSGRLFQVPAQQVYQELAD
ncbi:symmetrical bis(5'-nucleosyl)-tetraphosphatase [Andreprevotia chitinilytica]|uniref:symmetrical bis(5'-nucleosyl)-tetraphosphatase n=1 Tax=Andreprevotia chitinilytica TaxID=396808 RepID=UPI0005548984|nr:symmetrical bis(5'-nucleosyl)-tetraphosphatase [Andreprevotia chitinilytica]